MDRLLGAATSAALKPPAGLPMSGYLGRHGRAAGALDDLEANLLWLVSSGSPGILWISLDVLAITPGLRGALVNEIAHVTGIERDRVVVAASHTHSAPASWHEQIHPVFPGEFAPEICAQIASRVAQLANGLTRAAQPVSLTWRAGDVRGVGSNRHHVDGPHDPTLGLLEVSEMTTQSTIALLFDYACHPTVLGPENLHWSADWVAGARRHVRNRRGWTSGQLPMVFLQGCAGDVSTRFFRNERTAEEIHRLGGRVGRRMIDLLATSGVEIASAQIRMDRTTFHLPVRDFRTPGATGEPHDAGRVKFSVAEGRLALRSLQDAGLPDSLDLPVSVVTLGQRRWMHLPVEMSAAYGMQIAMGRDDVRVVGYSDSYRGYIADRESFRAGQYEALTSFFDEETCHRFMVECRDYLGRVNEMSRS